MTITINNVQGLDEFRDLILHCIYEKATCPDEIDIGSDKSKSGLKENIEKYGFLDTIKCWQDPDDPDRIYIIDGYTRMSIWHEIGKAVGERGMKSGKVPKVEVIRGLRDRETVKLWIIQNQLGRRNLNAAQRSYLRGKQYEITKKKRGGNEQTKPPILPPPTGQHVRSVENTSSDKIGQDSDVNERTVRRDADRVAKIDKIAEEAPEFAETLKNERVVSEKELTKIAESANIEEAIETVMKRKETKKQEGRSVEELGRLVVKHMEQANAYLLQIDQKTGRISALIDTQTFLHRALNHWNNYIRGNRG